MVENDVVDSLEEIASKYSLALMDTSFFSESFRNKKNLITVRGIDSVKEKANIIEKEHQFRIMLIDYLERGFPYFITYPVSKEYSGIRHYPYKKIIRKMGSNNRELLNLRRQIRDSEKEKRRLIDIFEENDKILQLSEEEKSLYDVFSEKYYFFKNVYELSDVDFDLFISGAVLSKARNSSALASNDFGIVHAWRCFLKKENISPNQFGFFVKRGINFYWKLT